MSEWKLRIDYHGFIKHLPQFAESVTAAAILLTMLTGVVQIVCRFFGSPLTGAPNLSTLFLVIVVYLSLWNTQRRKQHVSVGLISSMISQQHPKVMHFIKIIRYVLALCICGILMYAAWDYAIWSFNISEKMSGEPFYPIYPSKIAIAFGLSILFLQLMIDLKREFGE